MAILLLALKVIQKVLHTTKENVRLPRSSGMHSAGAAVERHGACDHGDVDRGCAGSCASYHLHRLSWCSLYLHEHPRFLRHVHPSFALQDYYVPRLSPFNFISNGVSQFKRSVLR